MGMCKKKEKKALKNINFLKVKIKYFNHDIYLSKRIHIKRINNFRLFSKFPEINKSLIFYLLKNKGKILKFKKKNFHRYIENHSSKSLDNGTIDIFKNFQNSKSIMDQTNKLKPLDHISMNLNKTFNMKSIINPMGLKNKFKNLSRQFHGEKIKTNYN